MTGFSPNQNHRVKLSHMHDGFKPADLSALVKVFNTQTDAQSGLEVCANKEDRLVVEGQGKALNSFLATYPAVLAKLENN